MPEKYSRFYVNWAALKYASLWSRNNCGALPERRGRCLWHRAAVSPPRRSPRGYHETLRMSSKAGFREELSEKFGGKDGLAWHKACCNTKGGFLRELFRKAFSYLIDKGWFRFLHKLMPCRISLTGFISWKPYPPSFWQCGGVWESLFSWSSPQSLKGLAVVAKVRLNACPFTRETRLGNEGAGSTCNLIDWR